jgi:alkylation response protein AidB-like acyl-CoA dehydrogenase
MRFALDEDQEALRSLARRFFDTESTSASVRRVIETAPGYDTSAWARLADVGFTGLAIPERTGAPGPRPSRSPSSCARPAGLCCPARSCPP